ncbi:MAG: 5-formyltetrahydrofolate cyclo-ligase [Proteobacteria bacterium]|nr:5-formyltetrahydrofolate cyclo-ligase [Pseudomonadota bacterium]
MTSSPYTISATRKALRAALLSQRRSLGPAQRAAAARQVARTIDTVLHLRSQWRLAVYAPVPGELDTTPLIELARRRGCTLYLPRIDRRRLSRRMRFVAMTGPMRRNRLGIAEPVTARSLGARWLDVVVLPLVGFDATGLRLGSGGGYYDRAFAFRHNRKAWRGPLLVGIAYACQQIERITAADHDVRMDLVVTEKEIVRCATG